MPSVMDSLRVFTKLSAMKVQQRNQVITDTIAWLESSVRPNVKPDHLSFLVDFENELQQQLNQPTLSNTWQTKMMQTYGNFPFYDAFLRKM